MSYRSLAVYGVSHPLFLVQLIIIYGSLSLPAALATVSCPLVRLESSLVKVRDADAQASSSSCVDGNDHILRLTSAKNEYESFQVVVRNPAAVRTIKSPSFDTVENVRIDLPKPLKTAGVSLQVHRVEDLYISDVSDCDGEAGWWPDPLIPAKDVWFGEERNAFPAKFTRDSDKSKRSHKENLVFWIDLFVPPEAPAGDFVLDVRVDVADSAESGVRDGAGAFTLNDATPATVNLRIFDFSLPSSTGETEPQAGHKLNRATASRLLPADPYRTSYGLSTNGILSVVYGRDWRKFANTEKPAAELHKRYVELGLMHRLSFTHGGEWDPALAKAFDPARGEPDWQAFDGRWGGLLDSDEKGVDLPFGLKDVKLSSFEAPGPGDRVILKEILGVEKSKIDPEAALNVTAAFYRHVFFEKNWPPSKLVSKVCDEPATAERWRQCADTCKTLKDRLARELPDPGTGRKLVDLVRCEVTTSINQIESDAANVENKGPRKGEKILDEASVGVLTALINFMECTKEHCSDYPTWSFRNTRPDYDEWLSSSSANKSKTAPNRELWLYQSCMSDGCSKGIGRTDGCVPDNPCRKGWPSLMVDNPKPLMHRALPVVGGSFYNASGELYWHVNYGDTCTRDNPNGNCPFGDGAADGRANDTPSRVDGDGGKVFGLDTWSDQLLQGGNGDGQLTYPGTGEKIGGSNFVPVAGIRLKALRDGIEDGMWLSGLKNLERRVRNGTGSSKYETLLAKLVKNAFTYETEAGEWLGVRDLVGEEIERLFGELGKVEERGDGVLDGMSRKKLKLRLKKNFVGEVQKLNFNQSNASVSTALESEPEGQAGTIYT